MAEHLTIQGEKPYTETMIKAQTQKYDRHHKQDAFVGIENELSAEGLFRLALWFQNSNDLEKAFKYYGLALDSEPDMVAVHYNIGVLHYEQKRWSQAITHFRAAVNGKPDFADAAFNLASALRENHCPSEAAKMYHYVIELKPDTVPAHYYQALCLQEIGNHTDAIDAFKAALSLDHGHALCWFHLAASIIKTQSIDQVLICYQNAVTLRPQWDKAHYNLAIAMRLKERLPEAIAHMQQAININPHFYDAIVYLYRLAQHACDWTLMETLGPRLDHLTARQLAEGIKTAEIPLINLRRQAHPQTNLAVARSWSQHIASESSKCPDIRKVNQTNIATTPLRIGYLSNDFKDHAVAHQIRGMLAAHNRQDFEIVAYIANADDGTRYRKLLCDACDEIRDISDLSPFDAARQIHADGVHILVEMSGHSKNCLLPIAAMRPASIQVSYLGFLGSTGADFIDYVIADAVVVPQPDTPHYTEKVVHMPYCYQANDDQQVISQQSFCRQDFDLPANGFVYCSFNQPYKIDRMLFKAWMNILRRVDGSVLWLIERSPLATQKLRSAAEEMNVDPRRLVFTGFIPLEDNLARLRMADLVLDTWQYNGGATTANALWAGVPVLTLQGNHWVSRMTASALHAINMPELITRNKADYQQMAVNLALTPNAVAKLKNKLTEQRTHAPLFNTHMFTRHLEMAYQTMWKRHVNGLPPISFKVEPLMDPENNA